MFELEVEGFHMQHSVMYNCTAGNVNDAVIRDNPQLSLLM